MQNDNIISICKRSGILNFCAMGLEPQSPPYALCVRHRRSLGRFVENN